MTRVRLPHGRRAGGPVRAIKMLASVGVLVAAMAGCRPTPSPEAGPARPERPVDAVTRLADDLRRNDLAGYARDAVPPDLHARLDLAWRDGRTVWPLTELPLGHKVPAMLVALAAPDAEKTLMATYDRQFSGARRELQSTASALSVFAVQYVENEGDYSDEEREHYAQVARALGEWGQAAPLAERAKALPALKQLIAAARLTGLGEPEAFASAGMDRGLARVAPFAARFRTVLAGYGLDLDATLAGLDVSLVEQTGDTARVRLQYTLAGQPVDAIVNVERRDGTWYLTDLLRHAEDEAGKIAPASGPTPEDTAPGAPSGS